MFETWHTKAERPLVGHGTTTVALEAIASDVPTFPCASAASACDHRDADMSLNMP